VPATDTTPFKNKTRVRVTTPLPGIPEGTVGTVKDTVGFALARHRVAFDNGRFVTSVARTKLVRDEDWDDFLREREEAETRAAEEPAAPTEAAPAAEGGEEAAAPQDDRMAALLARSKAAREKKASAG
jgi:hypothetical protein